MGDWAELASVDRQTPKRRVNTVKYLFSISKLSMRERRKKQRKGRKRIGEIPNFNARRSMKKKFLLVTLQETAQSKRLYTNYSHNTIYT